MNIRIARVSILSFLRHHAVFAISLALAFLSMIFVPPSLSYISYIDFGTLALLFALMAAVSGFFGCGVFDFLAQILCRKAKGQRSLCAVLIFLCFFSSMLITNDVSLIAFVPFSIFLLKDMPKNQLSFVISLQTIAANMGSIVTPVGNPQNLYIFGISNMKISDFVIITLPFAILSLLLLCACIFLIPKNSINEKEPKIEQKSTAFGAQIFVHIGVFAFSLFCVFGLFPRVFAFPFAFLLLLIFDRKSLAKVDFYLLLTFCAFFIFSGNLANIGAVKSILSSVVKGHEFAVSLLSSQILSNVPSALMLFRFCEDIPQLLLGVDIGGLGTPVASLASLISLSFAVSRGGVSSSKFLLIFSILNAVFLVFMILLRLFLLRIC